MDAKRIWRLLIAIVTTSLFVCHGYAQQNIRSLSDQKAGSFFSGKKYFIALRIDFDPQTQKMLGQAPLSNRIRKGHRILEEFSVLPGASRLIVFKDDLFAALSQDRRGLGVVVISPTSNGKEVLWGVISDLSYNNKGEAEEKLAEIKEEDDEVFYQIFQRN
ncbi:hypothetical protein [Fluviicoccus keumensis]|uniref:hypothetical protein n=1 Tax=Fluviicoccus keumensis TaxID=1435465 RepID=UPI00102CC79F|nr:hypothetical protein [Fluviicoccus keumensis]